MTRLPVRAQVRLRWGVALAVGIMVGATVLPWLGIAAGLLAGWAALTLVSMAWVLLHNGPIALALLLCVLVGCLAGCINGVIISTLKVPPFIVTLGTLSIFTATALTCLSIAVACV